MAGSVPTSVAAYFGAQLHKERIKAKLSIAKLARMMEMDDAHLGRVERGVRQPTREIAAKLDEVFPHREGAFLELYEASRSWVPAAFRAWGEYEDRATRLMVWSPGIIHGLLQTSDYARALLSTAPGVNDEIVTGRLTARMDRQRRILHRDDPPHVWFVVDLLSLYREVGSPAIMAAQLHHLAEVAGFAHVTMAVMPAVAHNSNESGFIIGDNAAYAESVASRGVHTDQAVAALLARFGSLQGESYRVAESAEVIRQLEAVWASGASPLTAVVTGVTASKRRPREAP
jgi:transcriptional regulator with XRE-family HTH domain